MAKEDINKFLEEISISTAWAEDFANEIKDEKTFEAIKEIANLKGTKGERLYDNFQLFQFLGEETEQKANLAKRFLQDNPEYSTKNFNLPLINYIIKNELSEEAIDALIKNAR